MRETCWLKCYYHTRHATLNMLHRDSYCQALHACVITFVWIYSCLQLHPTFRHIFSFLCCRVDLVEASELWGYWIAMHGCCATYFSSPHAMLWITTKMWVDNLFHAILSMATRTMAWWHLPIENLRHMNVTCLVVDDLTTLLEYCIKIDNASETTWDPFGCLSLWPFGCDADADTAVQYISVWLTSLKRVYYNFTHAPRGGLTPLPCACGSAVCQYIFSPFPKAHSTRMWYISNILLWF